jgi:uncharacterized membrane protein YoaK (UPF0700 family)
LSAPFVPITQHNKTIVIVATRDGDRAVVKKKTTIPMKWAVASGVLLAFNSGFINGACLSGAVAPPKQAVVAVTGAWTNSAIGFASGNMEQFKTQISMILSYLTGSVIAGALNPRPVAFELPSSTGPLFLIGSVLLYLSSSWASSGVRPGWGSLFSRLLLMVFRIVLHRCTQAI